MYFNDLHILYYVAFAIIGLIIGQITGTIIKKFIEEKEEQNAIYKEEVEGKEKIVRYNYILMLINSAIYIFILYKFGIKKELVNNIGLIQFLVLSPFLISIIFIYIRVLILRRLLLIFTTWESRSLQP